MTRPGKIAAALTLLAALLVGSPAPARDSDGETKDLRQQVADLRDEVAQLRRDRARDSRATNLEMKLMDARLARIERALERLAASRMERSTSRFFDPNAVPVGTGTIRLRNNLPVTAWVTVDGVRYRVPAFGSRLLRDRPAGPITYSSTAVGFGEQSPISSSVAANETLTITVRHPDFE
jgi:hypothetical protein